VLPTLTHIESRYSDKVMLVFQDYPIHQLHPGLRKAHEAARCGNEQGKFYAYHDVLFANTPQANPEQLEAYAQEVGLDVSAFEQCFGGGNYQAAVQKDAEESTRAGVISTPAFFIKGRMEGGSMQVIVGEVCVAR
jgi:protein-disulfide isomerase